MQSDLTFGDYDKSVKRFLRPTDDVSNIHFLLDLLTLEVVQNWLFSDFYDVRIQQL